MISPASLVMPSESIVLLSTAVASPSYPPCHRPLTNRWNQGSTHSSYRAAVSGSILARFATSATSDSSTNFQPRLRASISARVAPPLPYSRLMVMTLNTGILLVFCHHRGFHRHAHAQEMITILSGVENDPDRNPLHHFDVVACGVFRREETERFAGGAGDIQHV